MINTPDDIGTALCQPLKSPHARWIAQPYLLRKIFFAEILDLLRNQFLKTPQISVVNPTLFQFRDGVVQTTANIQRPHCRRQRALQQDGDSGQRETAQRTSQLAQRAAARIFKAESPETTCWIAPEAFETRGKDAIPFDLEERLIDRLEDPDIATFKRLLLKLE